MARGQEIDQLFWSLNASTVPLVSSLGAGQSKLRKFSSFMKTPIGALTALGAAATLAGAKATAMAAELDKAIREVATLLPGTVEDMAGLRDEVIALSTRVPDPPPLLTKGLYQIISAGITDASDAMFVLEVASRAAVAGITDTFTASDALTTVLNAFQLEASEATHVADVFFATIREGKTTFPELASTIGNVATSAALAGLSMEEMGAAIATMTKFGIDTSEATSSLNRLLFSMINNSPDAIQAAKDMGLQFDFARMEAVGFTQVMREVREATDGNIQAMAEINPSIRSLRALLILAGDGFEEYERITAAAGEATGAADLAFEKMKGSLQTQWALLKNKVNVGWLKFGNVTLPLVTGMVTGLNAILGETTDLMAEFSKQVQEFPESGLRGMAGLNRQERERLLAENERLRAEQAEQPFYATTAQRNRISRQILKNEERITELLGESTIILERQKVLRAKAAFDTAAQGDEEGEIVKFTEDQLALQEKLGASRAGILAGMTTTAVDDMLIQFQSLVDDIVTAFGDVPDAWQEVLDQMLLGIRSVGIAETMNAELDVMIQSFEQNVGVNAVGALALFTTGLQDWVTEARRMAAAAADGSTEQKRYNDLAERGAAVIEKLRANSRKLRDGTKGATKDTEGLSEATRDLVTELALASRGVLDLAQAFGVLDRDAASALGSAINIGTAINSILKGGLTGGAVGAIFGGAANIVGLAMGGGQPSAAQLERERVLEVNTEALERLKSSIDTMNQRLVEQQPGALVAGGGGAFAEAFRLTQEMVALMSGLSQAFDPFAFFMKTLEEQLAALGITMDDVRAFAKEAGIELTDSIDSWRAAMEAIVALDIEAVFKGFTNQLSMLRREFNLFDTDPMDRVSALLALLGQYSDIELPDASDPNAVDNWVREVFRAIAADPEGFMGGLHGISLQEFLDLLGLLEGTIDSIEQGAEDGVTQGFVVSRTITEVTGNRMAGLLTTQVHWSELIADRTQMIVDLLSALSVGTFGGLEPEPDDPFGSKPPGGGPTIIPAPVYVSADITVSGAGDPEVTARAVRAELEAAVDSRLGTQLTEQRRALGLRPVTGLPR